MPSLRKVIAELNFELMQPVHLIQVWLSVCRLLIELKFMLFSPCYNGAQLRLNHQDQIWLKRKEININGSREFFFLLRQYKITCKFSELATSIQFKFFIFSNVIAVTAWGPENAGTNLMTLTVCFVPSQMKEFVLKMCKLFFFTVLFKNHSFQPILYFGLLFFSFFFLDH